MSDFKIATQAGGVAGLTALDALTTPVTPDPQFAFDPFTEYQRLGDGSYRGQGAPWAEWSFPVLSLVQRNQLAAFCTGASAWVYLRTPKNGGTFANFLAVLRLPSPEPPIKAGELRNYTLRFEQLAEQS